MTDKLTSRLREAHSSLTATLLAELPRSGGWAGQLSSSALSTATAVMALATVASERHLGQIQAGLNWLAAHVNPDGGWGDTIHSRSNLSTTALVWAAFGATRSDDRFPGVVRGAVSFLEQQTGSLDNLVSAIEAGYGQDRTFSVPIIMTLALSGRLGPTGWERVRPLPFELAALPRSLFRTVRMPVVSYALPALIAIGQVIHHHAPGGNPLRLLTRGRTLELLTTLQPSNGGFLEATPLTSFVTMSLAAMHQAEHIVARRGAAFLVKSARADGSWPIDTNLATWVTTLAIKALRSSRESLGFEQRAQVREWLLGQQWRVEHPYTGAAPGGWAWTDLPGGVPDADDTSGALLALAELREPGVAPDWRVREAVALGVDWLLGLQNRDGGIPTFCRGWGTLPFDRSTPEITAHALRSWAAWAGHLGHGQAAAVARASRRALAYLARSRRPDGTWVPLWFGNESAPGQENPVYGTAQVLSVLDDVRPVGWALEPESEMRARAWLVRAQHTRGGWGGAPGVTPTIEETALALSALAGSIDAPPELGKSIEWLLDSLGDHSRPPAPIGLYFARLWYFERMYPSIFSLEAIGRLLTATAPAGGRGPSMPC